MELTLDEEPVVRRAVAAYDEARKGQRGPFKGRTADQILEELRPSIVRWTQLAAFVIEEVEGPIRRNRHHRTPSGGGGQDGSSGSESPPGTANKAVVGIGSNQTKL